MCLDGYGQVETMDERHKSMRFCKKENLFLSARIGRCLLVGNTTILKIGC